MFHLYHCIIQVEINHIQFYSLVMYLLQQSVYIYFHYVSSDCLYHCCKEMLHYIYFIVSFMIK